MVMGNLLKPPLMLCEDRRIATRVVFCFCVAATPAFFFSTIAFAETPHIETSLTVSETFTDNAQAAKNGQSDWITEISPSVSLRRAAGRVTGNLDASIRNLLYANDSSLSESFLTLSGSGKAEIIDNTFFVDVTGVVSRNNLSAFQGRPQWDSQNTSSQSETRYLSIRPRWVGHIGNSDVQYAMSYDGQALSYGSNMSDQNVGTFHARLFDPTAGARFGWSIDYNKLDNSYSQSNQQNVNDESLTGTLTFYVTRQLSLRLIAGTETNNYMTGSEETGAVTGYGFNWRPTPLTNFDGTWEHHVYGDTYDVRFSHRRALVAFDLSATRQITSSYATAANTLGSYYYNLFSASLVSQYPDPVQRDQATRELMKSLGVQGVYFGNTYTNSFYEDQRVQAGVSLIGVRHVLALSAYHSDQTTTNRAFAFDSSDNFANNDNVKSWGWTVSLSHQLTPSSSLTGALFWSKSDGSGGVPSESNKDTGLIVGYNRQLGPKTSCTVNFRHESSSGDNGFNENALTASLTRVF